MVGIIIQARMGSTRLPGKILKTLGTRTLLEHIFFRLSRLRHDRTIVLATGSNRENDEVVAYCSQHGWHCFRGSESDVLDRYYECAKKYGFSHIVRLTGDNPFVDAEEIDRLIELHCSTEADYSSSIDSLPMGIGAEIFAFSALKKVGNKDICRSIGSMLMNIFWKTRIHFAFVIWKWKKLKQEVMFD